MEFSGKVQKNKYNKKCFVPLCENTNKTNPPKGFFYVPRDEKLRKKWFKIAHRKDEPNLTTNYWCCEDHFDVEEDMENYIKFKFYGGPRTLKPEVVPHKFHCQPNRISTSSQLNRPAFTKINRKRSIQEILAECSLDNPLKSCQNLNTSVEQVHDLNLHYSSELSNIENEPIPSIDPSLISVPKLPNPKVRKVHVRSKYIMCKPDVRDFECNVVLRPPCADAECSPIKFESLFKSPISTSDKISSSVSPYVSNSDHSYKPEACSDITSHSSGCNTDDEKLNQNLFLKLTKNCIIKYSKEYIGVPPNCLWILDLLEKKSGVNENNILLTLIKIKTNDSLSRLSHKFALSIAQVSRIFTTTPKILANFMKKLILIPSKDEVKKNLPLPFRANFSNVYTIIDAFEVEIQKPANPVQQSLTWSEYKKANTLKYLVACTPDGMIIFISVGFGGRTTDTVLFEKSGIMDILPETCDVMADRGFKNIDSILNKKKCKLIRPPSVIASQQPSKEDVLDTKKIASLRIHVERVIRRIREYKILEPHACLDLSYMKSVNDIAVLVCALINLQSPIIKM